MNFKREGDLLKYVIAIDPGSEKSGVAMVRVSDFLPIKAAKIDNEQVFVFDAFNPNTDCIFIEETQNYGMPAGKDLRNTILWSGRFMQHFISRGFCVEFIPRVAVKLALCNSVQAKDGNVIQALVDRFAATQKNHGKGTKKSPGWFYGFQADIWQAYALGVVAIDRMQKGCK